MLLILLRSLKHQFNLFWLLVRNIDVVKFSTTSLNNVKAILYLLYEIFLLVLDRLLNIVLRIIASELTVLGLLWHRFVEELKHVLVNSRVGARLICPHRELTTVQVIGQGSWLCLEILIVMSVLDYVLRRHIHQRYATVIVFLRRCLSLQFFMRHVGLLLVVGVAFVLIFNLDQSCLLFLGGQVRLSFLRLSLNGLSLRGAIDERR